MGSAASTFRAGAGEPSDADIAALGPIVEKGKGDVLFCVLPQNEAIKKRSPVCQLEVGQEGFRLLRSNTEDSLGAFPWGQIHSWASGPAKFTFRFFDDSKRTVVLYTLCMRDVPQLLAHIQSIIDSILTQRQSNVIGDETFENLKLSVEQAQAERKLDVLLAALPAPYFWAAQGRELVDLLPTLFDKVEAATQLHGRLVDQNRFGVLLDALESPADRDNVWARITAAKKAAKGERATAGDKG